MYGKDIKLACCHNYYCSEREVIGPDVSQCLLPLCAATLVSASHMTLILRVFPLSCHESNLVTMFYLNQYCFFFFFTSMNRFS